MKYFLDTEFIEGFNKPLFGKKRHFIDLISIGIFAEDGRTYYAISKEFNPKDADKWVMDNVIVKLFFHNELRKSQSFKSRLNEIGKYHSEIVREIIRFVTPIVTEQKKGFDYNSAPEFYGYYSDYDWVLFCSLFGRMIDLPKGFPMYCIDLKQTLDEKAAAINQMELTEMLVEGSNWKVKAELPRMLINIDDYSTYAKVELLKVQNGFPKQTNEHNALADAKWNYELYKFLNPELLNQK